MRDIFVLYVKELIFVSKKVSICLLIIAALFGYLINNSITMALQNVDNPFVVMTDLLLAIGELFVIVSTFTITLQKRLATKIFIVLAAALWLVSFTMHISTTVYT